MTFTNIVIISGPSGAGEDSVIEGIAQHITVNRVITTTTREPRATESDGHPYHFITKEEFEKKIEQSEMVEWAEEYNGELYGVTKDELMRIAKLSGLGIWKVEYKGVLTVHEKFPEIRSILITAPKEVLEARIRRRDRATDSYIHERMAYTSEWLKHTGIYDYIVENKEGQLAETISEVMDILKKEQYL